MKLSVDIMMICEYLKMKTKFKVKLAENQMTWLNEEMIFLFLMLGPFPSYCL